MATIKMSASEDFTLKLSRSAVDVQAIAKKAIYAGAKIVADRMKINLEGVLSDEATGELVKAMGVTPISQSDGVWNAHIGFDGYTDEMVAYQLIARVLESGTSTRPKKPFVRPTLNQTRKAVEQEMNRVIEEEMAKIFG
jgi:phage protein, HK97 gp10 family